MIRSEMVQEFCRNFREGLSEGVSRFILLVRVDVVRSHIISSQETQGFMKRAGLGYTLERRLCDF